VPQPQEAVFEVLTPSTLTHQAIEDLGILASQLSSSFRDMEPEQRSHTVADNLDAALANPDATAVFVHRDNGRIISTATANALDGLGWVDDVVTLEVARGRGLGRSVMHSMHSWLWEHGSKYSHLTSKPSREVAGTLYEKMGYGVGGEVYRASLDAEDVTSTLATVNIHPPGSSGRRVDIATGVASSNNLYTVSVGVAKILTGNKAWLGVGRYIREPRVCDQSLRVGNAMLQAKKIDSSNICFVPSASPHRILIKALAENGFKQRDTRLYTLDLVAAAY